MPPRCDGAGRVGGAVDLFPERGNPPVRRRGGTDAALGRPTSPAEARASLWSAQASQEGIRPLRREPVLDGARRRRKAGRGVHRQPRRAIDRLERAGVVMQAGERRRNRVYCAGHIYQVLEAPLGVP